MSVIFIAFFLGGFDWYSPQEFLSGTVVFRKQLRMPTCNVLCCLGMHGRGSQASAPASDAAGRRRRRRDAADRVSVPHRATWRFPNRADAAEIGANAAQIGPTRSVSACIGRNDRVRPKFKKKKKRCKTHRLT